MQSSFRYIILLAFLAKAVSFNYAAFMSSGNEGMSCATFCHEEFSTSKEESKSIIYELYEEEVEEEEEEEEVDNFCLQFTQSESTLVVNLGNSRVCNLTPISVLQNRKLYIYFSCLKSHLA